MGQEDESAKKPLEVVYRSFQWNITPRSTIAFFNSQLMIGFRHKDTCDSSTMLYVPDRGRLLYDDS